MATYPVRASPSACRNNIEMSGFCKVEMSGLVVMVHPRHDYGMPDNERTRIGSSGADAPHTLSTIKKIDGNEGDFSQDK